MKKALQIRDLVKSGSGLIEADVAERYRISTNEVHQQIKAANMMDKSYFPITNNPKDPNHRSKYSYFHEFVRNGKIQQHVETKPNLPEKFSEWVRDGKITRGESVRQLPRVLESEEATRVLEIENIDEAVNFLNNQNPKEQELYSSLEKIRLRLANMTYNEIEEAAESSTRTEIIHNLSNQILEIIESVEEAKMRNN